MAIVHRPNFLSIAAIMIILLILVGVIPAFFTTTQGTEIRTLSLSQGETTDIQNTLSTTLTDVSDDGINISVVDTAVGQANTTSLNETETTNFTLRNNQIDVTYVDAIDSSSAIVTFEYPVLYEWNETSIAFIGVIAVLILVIFLYILWIHVVNTNAD